MRFGKRQVCQHFIFAACHERRDLGVLFTQLVGNQTPLLVAFSAAILSKNHAQKRRHHGALALANLRHGVTHEMHAAALSGRVEDLGSSGLEPFMGVRYDQLHAPQNVLHKALQEVRPERFGLRGGNLHAQHLAPAVGVHRHGDYYGDRDDASGLPHLDVSGVDPQVRPSPSKGRSRKVWTRSSISLASLDTWLLEMLVLSMALTTRPPNVLKYLGCTHPASPPPWPSWQYGVAQESRVNSCPDAVSGSLGRHHQRGFARGDHGSCCGCLLGQCF